MNHGKRTKRYLTAAFLLLIAPTSTTTLADVSEGQARQALQRATRFFRTQVSTAGGYLWRYSTDLELREGEGKASATTVWVQPPGTPSVGDALLRAFQRTGDASLLRAARAAALALVQGQLQSGGWDYRIEFESADRGKYAYRYDNRSDGRNTTTLDDDTTQAALRFLMRMDAQLEFSDKAIHDSVEYALQNLLKAQYPNGAWPQRYDDFPNPAKHPVLMASYPETWSRTYVRQDYRGYYTLNDNTLADMISTMFLASDIYNDESFARAARRGGDFLLLSQMPAPQPAWAQQYNSAMHPAWARKFEPPAITGGESQGAIRVLMDVFRRTGDQKYLDAIAPALDYLEMSRLPDGRVARFYELQSNRPLYFTSTYELTYDDNDLPTHYSFKSSLNFQMLRAQLKSLRESSQHAAADHNAKTNSVAPSSAPVPNAVVRRIVDSLDKRGAWVEQGGLRYHDRDATDQIINCRTFITNVDLLSQFIRHRHLTESK